MHNYRPSRLRTLGSCSSYALLNARGHFNVLMQTLIRVAVCKAGYVPRPHARTEDSAVNFDPCIPR